MFFFLQTNFKSFILKYFLFSCLGSATWDKTDTEWIPNTSHTCRNKNKKKKSSSKHKTDKKRKHISNDDDDSSPKKKKTKAKAKALKKKTSSKESHHDDEETDIIPQNQQQQKVGLSQQQPKPTNRISPIINASPSQLESRLDKKIIQLDDKFENRFVSLESKFDDGFGKLFNLIHQQQQGMFPQQALFHPQTYIAERPPHTAQHSMNDYNYPPPDPFFDNHQQTYHNDDDTLYPETHPQDNPNEDYNIPINQTNPNSFLEKKVAKKTTKTTIPKENKASTRKTFLFSNQLFLTFFF
jgi:hypothetical protein